MLSYRTRRRKIRVAVERAMADITEEWEDVGQVTSVVTCSSSAEAEHRPSPAFQASSHLVNRWLTIEHRAILLYKKFHERTDFFSYPLPSSHLGIYKVSLLHETSPLSSSFHLLLPLGDPSTYCHT